MPRLYIENYHVVRSQPAGSGTSLFSLKRDEGLALEVSAWCAAHLPPDVWRDTSISPGTSAFDFDCEEDLARLVLSLDLAAGNYQIQNNQP